jgi:hypothetical protein
MGTVIPVGLATRSRAGDASFPLFVRAEAH